MWSSRGEEEEGTTERERYAYPSGQCEVLAWARRERQTLLSCVNSMCFWTRARRWIKTHLKLHRVRVWSENWDGRED